jgi:hypothetical protein
MYMFKINKYVAYSRAAAAQMGPICGAIFFGMQNWVTCCLGPYGFMNPIAHHGPMGAQAWAVGGPSLGSSWAHGGPRLGPSKWTQNGPKNPPTRTPGVFFKIVFQTEARSSSSFPGQNYTLRTIYVMYISRTDMFKQCSRKVTSKSNDTVKVNFEHGTNHLPIMYKTCTQRN